MSKHVTFRALTFGAVFLVAASSPDIFRTAAQDDDEHAIRLVEDQIEEATGRNDADALSKLWAADYLFVNPAGQRLTAAQRLQMFRSGEMKVQSYHRDQESIRVYGATAIVSYRSTVAAARKGTDISSQRRVTTVLWKRNGRWQAVSQQTCRILQAAGESAIGTVHRELAPAGTAAGDAGEVQQVEQQIADATGKGDADALEALWSPDYVWVGPGGQVLTGAQRLAMIRSGRMKSERYTIDHQEVRMYGATSVVIFRSTGAGVLDGKDISSDRRVTNVLVKQDGRWQAVWQHSTLVQQP